MKEYPIKDIENELMDVCECGHDLVSHSVMKGNCYFCACPKYKFEQKLSRKDVFELYLRIKKNAEKSGFIK